MSYTDGTGRFTQEEEARRKAKKQNKDKKADDGPKASTAPTTRQHETSSGAGGKRTATRNGAPAAKSGKTNRPAHAGKNRALRDDGNYKITDYVKEDVMEEAHETHQDDAVMDVDNTNAAHHEQPALVTGGRLRPYQIAGVDWLKALFENGLNGILGRLKHAITIRL